MTNNEMMLISNVLMSAAADERSWLANHHRDTPFGILAGIEDQYGQLRYPACAAFVAFHNFVDEQIEAVQ